MSDLLTLLNEDSPLRPTPETSKQGWPFLAGVIIGCTICVPVFVMGTQLGQQLPFTQFVLGVFLGGLLCSLIGLSTGLVGQRTGLPTAMLAKLAFGSRGYVLANIAMFVTAVGWFGIQTGVFADAFVTMSQQVWGLTVSHQAIIWLAGLTMCSTAVVGFRGLGKLSYVAVPLLLVLLLAPLGMYYGSGQLNAVPSFAPASATLGLGTLVAIVAGAYSFTATMPDITRFLRTHRDTVIGMLLNFMGAYPLLLILTGSMAIAAGENDFMQIMLNLGFGSLAIAVLFLATWTTNDTNAYAAALSANLFLPNLPRWQLAAAIGVLGTAAASFGIFEHFMDWLIFTGNLFAPLAGVYVADYLLHPKRYHTLANIPQVRWPLVIAWLGGLGVGLLTTTPDSMGLGLTTLTTVPMLDALLTAAALTWLASKIQKTKAV